MVVLWGFVAVIIADPEEEEVEEAGRAEEEDLAKRLVGGSRSS